MLTVDYNRLSLEPGMRVLDLGAGFGRHAFATARHGASVVATDLAFEEMKATKNTFAAMFENGEIGGEMNTACVQADGTNLPFADASFDRVIASEVLEHVPDDLRIMAELNRVLAPGGRLAVTVPAALPEQLCWWLSDEYHAPKAVGGHVRIYGLAELEAKLAASGFKPGENHRVHALHSPYWWLKCAVGVDNDSNPFVRQYLRLLTWDIVEAPRLTRSLDKVLNPLLGKSLVVYADKPATLAPSSTTKRSGRPKALVDG